MTSMTSMIGITMEIHETWRFSHGEHWDSSPVMSTTVVRFRQKLHRPTFRAKTLVILAELFHYRVMAC